MVLCLVNHVTVVIVVNHLFQFITWKRMLWLQEWQTGIFKTQHYIYSQTLLSHPSLTRLLPHQSPRWICFPPMHFISLSRHPQFSPSPRHGCILLCVNGPLYLAVWLSWQHLPWQVVQWDKCYSVTLHMSAAVYLTHHYNTSATCHLLLHLSTVAAGWYRPLYSTGCHLPAPMPPLLFQCTWHTGVQLHLVDSFCRPNWLMCMPSTSSEDGDTTALSGCVSHCQSLQAKCAAVSKKWTFSLRPNCDSKSVLMLRCMCITALVFAIV